MNHALYRLCLLAIAAVWTTQSSPAQLPPDPVEESLPGPTAPLDPLPESSPEPDEPIQLDRDRVPQLEPGEPEEAPSVSFFVDDIQVTGATILQAQIEALVRPLEQREITLEDLLTLRADIARLYFENGYISSGAFVPTNQVLNDGVVEIQVVEGRIEQIQINGLTRLSQGYIRDRIRPATTPPLNLQRLEAALQLLQVDPILSRVDAELTAGSGPGQTVLVLDLTEADPFLANLAVNNYRAPSIGSLQGTASATYLNLLGFGDRLSASYDLTEGLDVYDFRYAIPVNGLDGTIQLRYENADSNIVESQFEAAGIRSESETFSVNFRQPLNRFPTNEFALGLGFDLRESRSFIRDDIPFSFSIGPEAGVSKVSALRFSQEWVNRDINTVLAARSQFSLGLDIFDATVNDTGTDGRFFSWLGQFQWVEQFSPGTLLVTRINTQLTPNSLLSIERFSVGGIDTVRGYAQNQIVADNAVIASTELRLPIATDLQLVPFIDAGGGWNNQTADPDPSFLLGLGLGMRWRPTDNFNLRLDYGIPLISAEDGDSLQENGLYFSVNLQPF